MNYQIKFNDALKQKYTQNLIQICDTINADTQYKTNPDSCKFCEYAKLCHKGLTC